MHGLTAGEVKNLARIREAMKRFHETRTLSDLQAAKRLATTWIHSNKKRRAIRAAASVAVRGLYMQPPKGDSHGFF